MAKKDKGIAKTMPMRVLDEAGVPYEVHLYAHKQVYLRERGRRPRRAGGAGG